MQDYVNLKIIKKRGSSINPDIHHSKVFSSECGYSDQIKFSYNLSKILTFSNWMEREFLNNIFNTVSVYRVTHNGRDFNAKFYGHNHKVYHFKTYKYIPLLYAEAISARSNQSCVCCLFWTNRNCKSVTSISLSYQRYESFYRR